MPADFERLASHKGARIRTISGPSKKYGLGKDEYIHIAFYGGESALGEKKKKKKEKSND